MIVDDYQVIDGRGRVVRDTAVERQRREDQRVLREGESFTASTDCPQCGHLAVHWLEEPRHAPKGDSPVARAQRAMAMLGVMGRPWFDLDETNVARICVKCEYRWGQR